MTNCSFDARVTALHNAAEIVALSAGAAQPSEVCVVRLCQLVRRLRRAIVALAIAASPVCAAPAASAQVPATTLTGAFTPVAPDPRATAVDAVALSFSAPLSEISLLTADLTLTRTTDSGTVSLPVTAVVKLVALSGSSFVLEGLRSLTAADGAYRLRLRAGTVFSAVGAPLAADVVEEWRMDTTGPLVAMVGPVTPDPRTDAVSTVEVRFTEPVSATTFTVDDLTLTRGGALVELNGVTTSRVSDTVYRIGGLGPLTRARGSYQLTVSPEEVADLLGNSGDRAFARSDLWQVVTRVSVAQVGPVTPELRHEPVDAIEVRFSEPVSATTFTAADIALTRDSQPIPLTAARVEALGAARFRVAGLAAATAAGGSYRLSVDAAGVLDLDDAAAGSGSASARWTTDTAAPSATLSAGGISAPGAAVHLFNVVYDDNLSIDESSIGEGDVTVSGPGGYAQPAALVGVTAPSATRRIAVYRITAPGGAWDVSDNGLYQVSLAADAVRDVAGNGAAGGPLGAFSVAAPAVYGTRQYLPVVGVGFSP